MTMTNRIDIDIFLMTGRVDNITETYTKNKENQKRFYKIQLKSLTDRFENIEFVTVFAPKLVDYIDKVELASGDRIILFGKKVRRFVPEKGKGYDHYEALYLTRIAENLNDPTLTSLGDDTLFEIYIVAKDLLARAKEEYQDTL